jgi:hypothetical protein
MIDPYNVQMFVIRDTVVMTCLEIDIIVFSCCSWRPSAFLVFIVVNVGLFIPAAVPKAGGQELRAEQPSGATTRISQAVGRTFLRNMEHTC